jgi:calcineurin-like phosphoesterase family protein
MGDFTLIENIDYINKIFSKLNGRWHMILGNHDKWSHNKTDTQYLGVSSKIVNITHYKEKKVSGQKIIMMHYPIESWNCKHHGSIHIHGHSHGSNKNSLPNTTATIRRVDVGVDSWNFCPVSHEQVVELCKQISYEG